MIEICRKVDRNLAGNNSNEKLPMMPGSVDDNSDCASSKNGTDATNQDDADLDDDMENEDEDDMDDASDEDDASDVDKPDSDSRVDSIAAGAR